MGKHLRKTQRKLNARRVAMKATYDAIGRREKPHYWKIPAEKAFKMPGSMQKQKQKPI